MLSSVTEPSVPMPSHATTMPSRCAANAAAGYSKCNGSPRRTGALTSFGNSPRERFSRNRPARASVGSAETRTWPVNASAGGSANAPGGALAVPERRIRRSASELAFDRVAIRRSGKHRGGIHALRGHPLASSFPDCERRHRSVLDADRQRRLRERCGLARRRESPPDDDARRRVDEQRGRERGDKRSARRIGGADHVIEGTPGRSGMVAQRCAGSNDSTGARSVRARDVWIPDAEKRAAPKRRSPPVGKCRRPA